MSEAKAFNAPTRPPTTWVLLAHEIKRETALLRCGLDITVPKGLTDAADSLADLILEASEQGTHHEVQPITEER